METSEQPTHGAIDAPDLAELIRRPGPFLSLYLNTEREVVNAAPLSQQRWKTARRDLERHDVPGTILEQIETMVPDAHLHGDCLAVIADAERILHVEHGPAVDPSDRASWGPVARLLPILRWRQSQPPYVVVVIDRTGADLSAFRRGSPELHAEVEGEHDVIRKVQAGGWSQRRYQRRAEDSWHENAEQAARAVTDLADRVEPVFVAVAGDVRAVELLRESLPKRVDELVHVVAKEPPRKMDEGEPIPEDVWALMQQHVRETTERLLARFAEERGQRDRAVEGVEAAARALAQGQVEALLIGEQPDDDRSLWFGAEPTPLAPTDRELKELGVDSPEQGPARDILVRAALGTGAGIRVLDDDEAVDEGVGALLRWSTS